MNYLNLVIFLIFLGCFSCQVESSESTEYQFDKSIIYDEVDEMPIISTCANSADPNQCTSRILNSFIQEKLEYPEQALEEELQGAVLASFVITHEGEINDVNILRDIGGGCGEAVEDILIKAGSLGWSPGTIKGQNLSVLMKLPVRFKLPEEK